MTYDFKMYGREIRIVDTDDSREEARRVIREAMDELDLDKMNTRQLAEVLYGVAWANLSAADVGVVTPSGVWRFGAK